MTGFGTISMVSRCPERIISSEIREISYETYPILREEAQTLSQYVMDTNHYGIEQDEHGTRMASIRDPATLCLKKTRISNSIFAVA